MDPNIELYAKIKCMARDVFHLYRAIYVEKKNNSDKTYIFMKKQTPATPTATPADNIDDPQSSTSD